MLKFLDKVHLSAKKILITYTYALILISLFFGSFIVFIITFTKQNITTILSNTPMIAVDMIIAVSDFLMGYYIWLKKDFILNHYGDYYFLMLSQAISQLMAGNLFCLLLAIFGIIRVNKETRNLKCKSKFIKISSIAFLIIFAFCLALVTNLFFRNRY